MMRNVELRIALPRRSLKRKQTEYLVDSIEILFIRVNLTQGTLEIVNSSCDSILCDRIYESITNLIF